MYRRWDRATLGRRRAHAPQPRHRQRRELVRAIYGSDQLGHYGIQPNPPIHIIVNRGKVTLTGYVNSQVDKALVNSMARQTLAFDVSNQVNVDGQSSGVDSKPDSQGDK